MTQEVYEIAEKLVIASKRAYNRGIQTGSGGNVSADLAAEHTAHGAFEGFLHRDWAADHIAAQSVAHIEMVGAGGALSGCGSAGGCAALGAHTVLCSCCGVPISLGGGVGCHSVLAGGC